MPKKSASSRRWLHEHFNDPYVKQAQREGYRSRSVYKLLELQERDKFIKPNMTVIDLGAAPGGWSQVLTKMVGKNGRIIALDILEMEPIHGVEIIVGDFTEDAVLEELMAALGDIKADFILSDMAPNLSGIDSVDQPRSIELAELALDLALRALRPTGGFLVKVFQGEGFDAFLVTLRQSFKKVTIRKPKASRDRSREVYILAKNY
jgi:23S rRNA (uridine2552-2'-O)-methyltransferase